MNTIPQQFVMHSALYGNVIDSSQRIYGKVDNESVIRTIARFKAEEPNAIIHDLYDQILSAMR